MPPQSCSKPARLIVVEDDVEAREALVELLELDGYQVDGCANARTAMASLSKAADDAILITDVTLPDADGITLALDATAKFPSCRVIVVSGHPPASRQYPAHWQWLQKPCGMERIVAAIGRLANT